MAELRGRSGTPRDELLRVRAVLALQGISRRYDQSMKPAALRSGPIFLAVLIMLFGSTYATGGYQLLAD